MWTVWTMGTGVCFMGPQQNRSRQTPTLVQYKTLTRLPFTTSQLHTKVCSKLCQHWSCTVVNNSINLFFFCKTCHECWFNWEHHCGIWITGWVCVTLTPYVFSMETNDRGWECWICSLDVPTWCQAAERLTEELRHEVERVCVCKRHSFCCLSYLL